MDTNADRRPPAPAALLDDQTLLARLRDRDEEAFARVVEAWTPTMTRIARRYVSTAASAEEVVQDTWVAVLSGLDRFAGRSSLRTWVFRILTNQAISRGVREGRTVPWSSLGDNGRADSTVQAERFQGLEDEYPGHWHSFPAPWPSPEGSAITAEATEVVTAAVRSLPHQQHVVLVMRDLLGFASDEVCGVLGLTPGNQRVLLHRARATVRSRLEEQYGAATRWGATT